MSLSCKEEDYYDDPIILFDQAELRSFEKEHCNFANTCPESPNIKFGSESITEDTKLSESSSELPQPFFYIPENLKLLNECRPLIIKIVDCEKHPWYYKKKYPKMDDDRNNIVPVKTKKNCKTKDARSDVLPKVSTFRSKFKCKSGFPDAGGKITSSKIKGEIDLTSAGNSTGSKNKIKFDFQKNKGLEGMKIKLVFELHENTFGESIKAIKYKTNNIKELPKNTKSKNPKLSFKDGVPVSTSTDKSCIKPKINIVDKVQNEIPCTHLQSSPERSPKIILGKMAKPRNVIPYVKDGIVPTTITTSEISNRPKQCGLNTSNKDNYKIVKNKLNDTTYTFKKIASNDKIHDNVQSANVTSTENLSSNNTTKSTISKSKISSEGLVKIKKSIKRVPKKSKCAVVKAPKQQVSKKVVERGQNEPKKYIRIKDNKKIYRESKLVDQSKINDLPILPDITITSSKNDEIPYYAPRVSNLTTTSHYDLGNIEQAKKATNANPMYETSAVVNYTAANVDLNMIDSSIVCVNSEILPAHVNAVCDNNSSSECKNSEILPAHVETVRTNFLADNPAKKSVKYNYEKLSYAPQFTQYRHLSQRNAINTKPKSIYISQNNNYVRYGRPIQTLVSGTLKDQGIVNIQAFVPPPRPHYIPVSNANDKPMTNGASQQQQAIVNHNIRHNHQMPRKTLLETPLVPYFNRFDNFAIKYPPTVTQNYKRNVITNTAANNAYSFNHLPNCPRYTEYFPYYMNTVPPPPPPPVRVTNENLQQQSNAVSSSKNVVPAPTKSVIGKKQSSYNKNDQNIKQITQYSYASPQFKSVIEGNIMPSRPKDYRNINTHHTYKPSLTKSVTEENLLLFREKNNGKPITHNTHISKPIDFAAVDANSYPKNFNEIEEDQGLDRNKIAEKIVMEVRNNNNDVSHKSKQTDNLRNANLPQTGYSPPILPIPTYENGLELLAQASLERFVPNGTEDSNKADEKICEKDIKRKLNKYDDNGSPKKKISIEEYKNRVNSNSQNNNNVIDLTSEEMTK